MKSYFGIDQNIEIKFDDTSIRDIKMVTDTLVEHEYMRSVDRYVDDMIDSAAYAMLARRGRRV